MIARAKRSFVFSIGLLIVGLIAVALAIVYRSDGSKDSGIVKYSAGALIVPTGAEILSAVPGEGMIAITYISNGNTKLRLVDGTTGAVIRDIDFVSE